MRKAAVMSSTPALRATDLTAIGGDQDHGTRTD
jgi:hypothetical protein